MSDGRKSGDLVMPIASSGADSALAEVFREHLAAAGSIAKPFGSARGRWDVVVQLARELEARRLPCISNNVVDLAVRRSRS